MKGYAYRDKSELSMLKVVAKKELAEELAAGEVKEVDCGFDAVGNPAIVIPVFAYGNGEVFVGGNRKSGTPLGLASPDIAQKAKDLLAKIGI